MHAIQHTPSELYTNIAFGSYDALNLGINPKIYATKSLAELDLHKIPDILAVDIKKAEYGIETFQRRYLQPLLEKNAVKLNATRTKNIQFYESKIASIQKELERFKKIQAGSFHVIEIKQK
jgi:hypothetical protein